MAPTFLLMGIFFRAQKMQRNIRLIANDPTIVARPDIKKIARLHDVSSSIRHRTRGFPGYHHANVLHLTKRSPGNRRDMLRPFPTGFVCRPADRHSADFDEFEPSFLKSANLIGFVESLNQEVNVIRKHETNLAGVCSASNRFWRRLIAKEQKGREIHIGFG